MADELKAAEELAAGGEQPDITPAAEGAEAPKKDAGKEEGAEEIAAGGEQLDKTPGPVPYARLKEVIDQKNELLKAYGEIPGLRSQIENLTQQLESLKTAAPKPPPEKGLAEQMVRDTVKQWMDDGMTEDEALEEWKSQSRVLLPIFRSMERQAKAQEEKMGKSLQPFQDKERTTRVNQIGAEVVKDPFYLAGGAKLDDNPLMGLLAVALGNDGVELAKADLQTVLASAGKLKATFYKNVLPGLFVQAVADKDPACMAGLAKALKAAMTGEIPEVVAVLTEAAEAYDALKDKQDKQFPPLGKGRTPKEIKPPDVPAAEANERSLQRATLAATGMGG